jgi:hypothetical protein
MRLSAEIRYDADPRRVFRMIVDRAFQESKCLASESLDHEVDITEAPDGGAVVSTRRTLSADDLPDVVRSFVGPAIHLHETQRWDPPSPDGGRTGSIRVEVRDTPVLFLGSMALTVEGNGTRWPIEGQLKVSIPLLGSRIERAAQPAVLAGIEVEQRTGTAWLAEHRP